MSFDSPAKTYKLTLLIVGGIGFAVFLFITGVAGWHLWHKSNFHRTHDPVTARVEDISTLCAVQHKPNKSWNTVQITDCAEANRIVAERKGVFASWRSVAGEYVLLSYNAGGEDRQERLEKSMLGDQPMHVGSDITMYVDRDDPSAIERPYQSSDVQSFFTMSAVGAGIAAFALLMGWGIGSLNRRYAEAVLAAGGTMSPQGHAVYPSVKNHGTAQALVIPLWTKVLEYVGLAVLIVGLVLAGLALLGNGADADTVNGAMLIGGLSVVIWRLCKYFASQGKRPPKPKSAITRG